MLRDGVILIVGTILMAIAFGQLAGAALKAPQWNWISFLGITTPGMFLLMGREGIKARLETWQGLARVPRLFITETLLVLGLAIMLYGSCVAKAPAPTATPERLRNARRSIVFASIPERLRCSLDSERLEEG